ncbi:MAG: CotH kinase family protein [Clostridium sp.]|nr:CotH kinase family protein [Clostridium sp.]
MKRAIRFSLLAAYLALPGALQAAESEGDTLCVRLKSGTVDVFTSEILTSFKQTPDSLCLTLITDTVIRYHLDNIEGIDTEPGELPVFKSYKFNNKYNHQLPTDVFGEITPDRVSASVGAIGKWLTASFSLNDARGTAYVDGQEQVSKESRLHFDNPVVYTLALPGMRTLTHKKVKDEVWSNPDENIVLTPLKLTADMLSTNAPSNYDEGLDKMIDGDNSTYFHSTWGTGDYEKLPLDECPYVQIHLNKRIKKWVMDYITRPDAADRCPSSFLLQASNDGVNWTDIRTLTEEDGLPTSGYSQTYQSPVISMDTEYEFLRLTMLTATYKNYLCLSELSISEVTWEGDSDVPVLISPAEYEYCWMPFGREVTVDVDWLTDHATNVPRIDINIENNLVPYDKVTYLNAHITIDGGGVFADFEDDVRIKGRGNTSWAGAYGKSPYRLKFASAVKPFGLTKGKNWVLLANNQSTSMMTNALAMKIAKMAGTAGANDIIPVELYLNGKYRGSYNFTQHVGLSNNSIDLDDETNSVFIELDSYYDEDYKFRDSSYNLYVNIKDPDIAELENGTERFKLIQSDFNRFTAAVKNGSDYAELIDTEMLARFLFVNELVLNLELSHPKSTFLYKEDLLALHSRYVFGPVWDFDWAFGYEEDGEYCTSTPNVDYYSELFGYGKPFFNALRFNSEEMRRTSYAVWKNFVEKHIDELSDYINEYYAYARPSFENNATVWSDGSKYATIAENMRSWLVNRAHYVYDNIETFDLTTPMPITVGDVNKDGAITMADVVCVLNYLLGQDNESFNFEQADADPDGEITVNDMVHIIALVMNQPTDQLRHLQLPLAEVTLQPGNFDIAPGQSSVLPITLRINEGSYSAMQADLTLPEGMTLDEVTLTDAPQAQIQTAELQEGHYRLTLHTADGQALPTGETALRLTVTATRMIPQAERVVSISNSLMADTSGEDNRIAPRSTTFNLSTETGIDETASSASYSIRGGEALSVESTGAGQIRIYLTDGRLLRTCDIEAGFNRIELPRGIYIVNNEKIIIK